MSTYTLLTEDREDGWVVRWRDGVRATWWWGPHYGSGRVSGCTLSRRVAVFDSPAIARDAMRAAGIPIGDGTAVVEPLRRARAVAVVVPAQMALVV